MVNTAGPASDVVMSSSHPALSRPGEHVRRPAGGLFAFLLHSTLQRGQMFRLITFL
jgi:hypothetical protein